MDDRLKQRLVGATVLVLAAVVFVPMLLDPGEEPPPRSERLIAPQPVQDAPARVLPLDERTPAAANVPAAKAPARPAAPAATPTAAPAKSTAPAPAGYAVQLGSFSKAENATGLRDKLVARGYTAFVETEGSITRVYVGPQASRAEAEKMLKKLLAETKLKGIVVDLSG
jgi:DedD protein